ncbi:MAG: InlB B-repeat-containing protein, partial [Kiritimatiellae bacterium]|nr:InlB B-repeat-containing protein [Kiritimatiellia bacterium]
KNPEDYGYYFWWGDTVGYTRENNQWIASDGSLTNFSFEESNTPTWGKNISTLESEGWITSNGVLAPKYDAAQKHWGKCWRIPTDGELQALIDNCTWEWATVNGVNGNIIRGKGDYSEASIFLPAAGFGLKYSKSLAGSSIDYWSSVPSKTDNISKYYVFRNSTSPSISSCGRLYGQSIRPVLEPNHLEYNYIVRFNPNGGIGEIYEQSFTYGFKQKLLSNTFTNEGCVFIGWSTSTDDSAIYSDAEIVNNLTDEINGVVNLYAVWSPIAYTIEFDANGGDGSMPNQQCAINVNYVLLQNVFTRNGYLFVGWSTNPDGEAVYLDGNLISNLTQELNSVVKLYAVWKSIDNINMNSHRGIQLWENGPYFAETNIGAENPEDYGYYFWWGDTVGYKYEDNSWIASNGSSTNFLFQESSVPIYRKNISTLKSEGWITSEGELAPSYDAAKTHWGGEWRMPTEKELNELSNNCTWEWTTMNGVRGCIVRGKGNYSSSSIFLPAAGYGDGSSLVNLGSYGYYWSSTPASGNSYYSMYIAFNSNVPSKRFYYRSDAQSVRPVLKCDYVLEFNANGGSGEMYDQAFFYGVEQALSANAFSRKGYTFAGWATSPDGEVVYEPEESITLTSSQTLYAIWIENTDGL